MHIKYENHNYEPDFPFFFHLDRISEKKGPSHLHWHEHVELLYFTKGECTVIANEVKIPAASGDLIMITPNCAHDIYVDRTACEYYCITVDRDFCDSLKIPICAGQFAFNVKEPQAKKCYEAVIELMRTKPDYFIQETKLVITQLLIRCCRLAKEKDTERVEAKSYSGTVARAVEYLRAHFSDPVSVDELCEYLGFSKYYICRKFKSETGKTVIEYLNFLRCANARRLILSGQHNISESALLSGFTNMSYFTKTFKKQMGSIPSSLLIKE